MDPAKVGVLGVVLLIFVGGLLLVKRGLNATGRGRRVARFAAGCSVMAVAVVLSASFFKEPGQGTYRFIVAAATITLALLAMVLAVGSFILRQKDEPITWFSPMVGLFLGGVMLISGFGLAASSAGLLVPSGGTPWVWKSDEHGFEITLPNERWKQNPKTPGKMVAQFSCTRPAMLGAILEVRPAADDASYEAALEFGKQALKADAPTNLDERSGTNANGHPYWMFIGDAKGSKGPFALGISITRVNGKAVLLLFEGQSQAMAEINQKQEAREFRSQAETFLTSVK